MRVSFLWVLAAVEVMLWLFGVIVGQTLGGFLHILLLLAALAALTEIGLNNRRTSRQSQHGTERSRSAA
ncbi:MAG TPA: DUF5670 family protein [Terriglobales bacterium]|nr:DUF5670 family protein [Terriglobales bacterium]